jgi:hypothetical protein
MDMQVRGWREERYAPGYDTAGRAVVIVTGLTVDHQGRTVAAMAIGQGPTVVLNDDLSQLKVNIACTLQDLEDARQAGQ